MRKIFTLLAFISMMLTAGKGWGQTLLLSDDFDNLTIGNLAGQSLWTKGGSGPDATVANTTKLTYAGYKGGDNEYVVMPTGTATTSRVYKGFTNTTAVGNTFYVSFLLRIASTTAIGDYFITLGDPTTGTTYAPRLFAKTSGAGFVLGASKLLNVASATFGTTVLSLNTTYLIVIRYTGVSGTANDLVYVWVNPSLSSEPSTGTAEVTVPATDTDPGFSGGNVGNFHWHNRSTNNPTGSFDGVRVAVGSTSALAWQALSPLATSFFSKSTGNLNAAANWGHNSNGSGSPAPNFTENNKIYNIRNNATPAIGADWTVSGTGSKIVVGDGTNACNFSLDYNLSATELEISANGTLTINAGKQASVTGTLTNSGALTIKSDATGTGSLIHSSSGVSATVERYVVGHGNVATDGWHLMGSPVATFNIAGSSFEPGSSDDLYGWSEATNTWMNYKAGNPTQIVPGTGYLVAYENTATKTFSGNLNVSDVSVSGLSHNASQGKGWHLLGNPFASALEWNKTGGSWALSNIAPTAKVWNSGSKAYNDIAANGIIPAAQGFFVQVDESTTGSLTIPASARTHSSTAWYKSTTPRILLSASPADGSSKQESQIRIEPEATAGFDFYHDSRFLEGYAPKFYSVAGGEMLSTNAMPQVQNGTSIPFGFVKNQHSSFVIRLEESLPGEIIQLKDLKLNLTHNLSQHPEYLFSAAEGDDPNRFLLVFGTVGINEKPGTQTTLQATMHNGQLWVNNPAENSQLSIHDLSGRMLQQMRLSASGLQQLGTNLKKGAYIIRLQGGEQTLSTKVINR